MFFNVSGGQVVKTEVLFHGLQVPGSEHPSVFAGLQVPGSEKPCVFVMVYRCQVVKTNVLLMV